MDVIRSSADHSLMSQAGLDEDEDIFAPLIRTIRRRSIWLGINLLTAFLASAVIGMFEATLEQVIATGILMPVVPLWEASQAPKVTIQSEGWR